jgi:hypothetical protein
MRESKDYGGCDARSSKLDRTESCSTTRKGGRLFVTRAKTGFVNLYDNSEPRQPKFIKAIASAPGAHHSVLSPDERYLFVQNSFLNLEGMSDGSITVIDLKNDKVLGNIDTLKSAIMLLPNHFQSSGLRGTFISISAPERAGRGRPPFGGQPPIGQFTV